MTGPTSRNEADRETAPDVRALVAAGLRAARTRSGLSLSEVARRAGVAKSTLSALEAGQGNPGVETLWALSDALGVRFSELVDPPPSPVRLLRAGEGPRVPAGEATYAATLLAACPPTARRDAYRITAEPGVPRRSTPHARGTQEHVVLAAGRALVGPTDEPVELAPGDYLAYPGDVAHVFEALEPGTWAVLLSELG
ncbi:MAG TPA: transcriptional regulator [Micrococcales bacterium]|uniref:helix-turn-helix domain-containing protein n=1 Tax=Miniimonas arenae TaxID=676201 RepID=UPI000ECBE133|nr:helix-turn-helix domain-containing protein [Miniimonas arenae]HCX85962.1 transcriptional regulator [Micrococcales bacterium]